MKEYHHGNLKQLLLDEGLKLLSSEGYEKFSLRKLARNCKVSHTSPYRHFQDKNELILAIAGQIQEKFNKALIEGLNSSQGTQKEKVKAMGRHYVTFFLENPDYLEVLFLTPELTKVCHGNHNHKGGSSLETYLSGIIPLMAGGSDIPAGPEALDGRIPGQLLRPWCQVHGLTVLLVKGAIPVTDPEAVGRLIDEVLEEV